MSVGKISKLLLDLPALKQALTSHYYRIMNTTRLLTTKLDVKTSNRMPTTYIRNCFDAALDFFRVTWVSHTLICTCTHLSHRIASNQHTDDADQPNVDYSSPSAHRFVLQFRMVCDSPPYCSIHIEFRSRAYRMRHCTNAMCRHWFTMVSAINGALKPASALNRP